MKIGFIYFQYFEFWICKARPFNICNKYVFISGGPKTPTYRGLILNSHRMTRLKGTCWRYVCRADWDYTSSLWTEEWVVLLLLRIMGEITLQGTFATITWKCLQSDLLQISHKHTQWFTCYIWKIWKIVLVKLHWLNIR